MTERDDATGVPVPAPQAGTPAASPSPRTPEWRVRAHGESIGRQVADTWRHRRLIPFFAVNAIRSVYQAAILGFGWLFIRPFIMAAAAVFVMRDVLGVSTDPIPYLLFVLTSFSLWIFFQRGVAWGTKSFQQHKRLMARFSFPALLIHATSLCPGLVEAAVVVLAALSTAFYFVFFSPTGMTIQLGWHTLAVVPAFMLAGLLVLGITSITTVLNNMARDTWYTMRYVLTIWTLATPVYYPRSAVPAPYDEYLLFNPMTPIIELYRWAIFHTEPMRWDALWVACIVVLVILLIGFWTFAKLERRSLGVG